MTEIVLRVISIIGLVALNGFFVLAEFSLVSVRPTRIDELVANGSHRAKVVKKLIDRQDDVISATQLGITIASLGL
ncbi:MAG TPA: CNNM domain-containing protein, partial [Candidatus Hodarchaeales archaeon]|nr:CNNM domain-containing protein [Candidatus Hodarchaeales archaeon]